MSDPAPNITLALTELAAASPRRPALVHGRRQVTFLQLEQAIWEAATHFARHGVTQGDILPILLSDQVGLAIAVLGAMRMGATPMPLSPGLPDTQQHDLMREADVRFRVANEPAKTATNIRDISFDLTRLPTDVDRRLLDARPSHPAKIQVGSGSTGKPLLIPYSHANIHARNASDVPVLGFQPGERLMPTAPLHYASPLDWLLEAVPHGLTFILPSHRTGLWASIAATRPDYVDLTVYHAHQLLKEAKELPGVDLSRQKLVTIGSSPVSEPLRAALRGRLKARLAIHYGTNEAGTLSLAFPDDMEQVPDTVGRPRPPVELQIVDPDDQPLDPGEIGLIRARSPGIINGYVGGIASERFRDGWFYPGDFGRWRDGQLVHCGRADQMMILNGINIYPAEIERCLERHPAVEEVAAYPLPHRVHGEIPVCAVTVRAGQQPTTAELEDWAGRELGAHRPRRIVILDHMPRTSMGKLIRKDLVSLATAAT